VSDIKYPIAETFYSLQGEGTYAGTPMFFVRLAGCNVGRYPRAPQGDQPESIPEPFQILHPEYATCTSFSNAQFICDTDYRVKERLTSYEIGERVKESKADHVCLTGGEPFIHNLDDLLFTLDGYSIHIETSGTKPIENLRGDWITCSPKAGFLKENVEHILEYKFLVRHAADEVAILKFLHDNEIEEVKRSLTR